MIDDNKELSNAVCSPVINAPVEKIDIAAWILKLPEGEYRRCCPPDHVSRGSTLTDEGQPMLVNVEMVGHALMVQRYVAETATSTLCRLVPSLRRIHAQWSYPCAGSMDPHREAGR